MHFGPVLNDLLYAKKCITYSFTVDNPNILDNVLPPPPANVGNFG